MKRYQFKTERKVRILIVKIGYSQNQQGVRIENLSSIFCRIAQSCVLHREPKY